MTEAREIPGGVVHDLPGDLEDALKLDPRALATWEDITPLARNEWICWIESARKPETRRKRIDWGRSNLRDGTPSLLLAGLPPPLKGQPAKHLTCFGTQPLPRS
jgi:hypothetical protein